MIVSANNNIQIARWTLLGVLHGKAVIGQSTAQTWLQASQLMAKQVPYSIFFPAHVRNQKAIHGGLFS